MWNDQDNIVFSPLCIHLALAILASGSTTGSKTEMELLRTLGRVQNIQALEQRYRRLLTSYNKVDIKQHLSYSNLLVTSQAYFDDIRGSFLEKLSYHYKSDMMKVKNQNIAENVNSYIHNMTFGNIDTLLGLGKQKCIKSTNIFLAIPLQTIFHMTWVSSLPMDFTSVQTSLWPLRRRIKQILSIFLMVKH